MTDRDNVLLVHWHDLGRYLGVYGHADVSSPRLDQLAAEGILFTRAHATAPLCSPSRGSLFTGRYPQSNGLVGLAHHGWEYRAGVRTLPHILTESWLVHSTFRDAARDVVPVEARVRRVRRVQLLLRVRRRAGHPLAIATRRRSRSCSPPASSRRTGPTRATAIEPADADARRAARTTCPTPPTCGEDLADFYGSISVADAAVGQLLDTLADDGTGPQHLGGVHHRSRAGAAAGQVHAVRRGHRHRDDRAATDAAPDVAPQVYDELFSGVDLVPTLLDLLGVDDSRRGRRAFARTTIAADEPASEARAHRGLHDEDVSRFVRSDPRDPHQGIQLHRELRAAAAAGSAVGHRRQRARARPSDR